MELPRRELLYTWYYFSVQLEQLFGWWVLGMLGWLSGFHFAKDHIHRAFRSLQRKRIGVLGIAAADALGSRPLFVCMG